MLITPASMANLFQGYNASYQQGQKLAQSVWRQIATEIPSSTETGYYPWLGHFPKLREWVGDRQLKSFAAHDYSIKNKDFEASIEIPKPKIEDDTYGVFQPMFSQMGYAAETHDDEQVFGLLAVANATKCYDGQYMIDTDHPIGIKGETAIVSGSNYQAGGGNWWYVLDTRSPLKPLILQRRKSYQLQQMTAPNDPNVFMRNSYIYGVDGRMNCGFGFWQQIYGSRATLSSDNLDAIIAAMMARQSDEGRKLGIMPNLLICGPSNRAAARAVLEATTLANGASNTNYKALELVVTPYLT